MAVERTRVGNPASPMASSTIGVLGLARARSSTRRLSEGLRAVVTILYPSAAMRVMRRSSGSSGGVPP